MKAFLRNYLREEGFEEIPGELLTQEMCLEATHGDGFRIEGVPDEFHSYQLFLAAVQQNGLTVGQVPPKFVTSELLLAAVQQDGFALDRISKDLVTDELCVEAINQNILAICCVPDEKRSEELCLNVARSSRPYALLPLHRRYFTEKVRAEIVASIERENIKRLQNPEEDSSIDYDLDFKLKYLQDSEITDEMIFHGLADASISLFHVPEHRRTKEICEFAIKNSRGLFELDTLPKKIATVEMIVNAIMNPSPPGYRISDRFQRCQHVPEKTKDEFFTKKMHLKCENDFLIIGLLPKKMQRPEIIFELLDGDLQRAKIALSVVWGDFKIKPMMEENGFLVNDMGLAECVELMYSSFLANKAANTASGIVDKNDLTKRAVLSL